MEGGETEMENRKDKIENKRNQLQKEILFYFLSCILYFVFLIAPSIAHSDDRVAPGGGSLKKITPWMFDRWYR